MEPITNELLQIIKDAAHEAHDDGFVMSGSPERQARQFGRANPDLALAAAERIERAEAGGAPGGGGPVLSRIVKLAEKYRSERRKWHRNNQHLINHPRSANASPELLDAELVAFLNYVGAEWGVDLAMSRVDFAIAAAEGA